METWVLITIAAAFLQNIRSVLQKHLKGVMGTTVPLSCALVSVCPLRFVFVALLVFGARATRCPGQLLRFSDLGHPWRAIAQIAGQALLIQMFSHRNFTVGTAYSRTEPAQAAFSD
jgi:hypothetical protein